MLTKTSMLALQEDARQHQVRMNGSRDRPSMCCTAGGRTVTKLKDGAPSAATASVKPRRDHAGDGRAPAAAQRPERAAVEPPAQHKLDRRGEQALEHLVQWKASHLHWAKPERRQS